MIKLFIAKIIKKIFHLKCDGDSTNYIFWEFKNHFYNKEISGCVCKFGPGWNSVKECYFCGKQDEFFTEW